MGWLFPRTTFAGCVTIFCRALLRRWALHHLHQVVGAYGFHEGHLYVLCVEFGVSPGRPDRLIKRQSDLGAIQHTLSKYFFARFAQEGLPQQDCLCRCSSPAEISSVRIWLISCSIRARAFETFSGLHA